MLDAVLLAFCQPAEAKGQEVQLTCVVWTWRCPQALLPYGQRLSRLSLWPSPTKRVCQDVPPGKGLGLNKPRGMLYPGMQHGLDVFRAGPGGLCLGS